jgi:hypothetical protein
MALPLVGQSLQVYSEFVRFDATGAVTTPGEPREILSPALVRNGFTSFQIVVRVEPGTPYTLVVGQNPEDAVKISLYRESADKLEHVDLPYSGAQTQIFWLDVWTDANAPVRRIKLEPQIYSKGDWFVYPMEARVMEATVPVSAEGTSICGGRTDPPGDTGRLHMRNETQDAALATSAPKEDLRKLSAACGSKNPESYLQIRDYLFRMR